MAIPARHHSRSRINKRRSHLVLNKHNLIKCPNCGRKILPHRVCPYCGYYKGRMVIDVYRGLSKKEKQKQEKNLPNSK